MTLDTNDEIISFTGIIFSLNIFIINHQIATYVTSRHLFTKYSLDLLLYRIYFRFLPYDELNNSCLSESNLSLKTCDN